MRWSILVFASLSAIVLLELVLRFGLGLGDPPLVVKDPKIEYRLVPAASYSRFGNSIEINSFGMRGPEVSEQASDTERRIILIGDSVVYGNHFIDQHETISAQLTSMLEDLPEMAGCQPVALAAAASSWGPVNQAAFLSEIGTLDAEIAVLIVSSHDLYDTPIPGDAVIPYRLRKPFGAIGDAVQIGFERLVGQGHVRNTSIPLAERREATLQALDQMNLQIRQQGISAILVYHPTTLERNRALAREHADFSDWARQKGVDFEILDGPQFDASLYRDHIHPSAEGAKAIAQVLAELIASRIRTCISPSRQSGACRVMASTWEALSNTKFCVRMEQ
jgi:hypothetical protein